MDDKKRFNFRHLQDSDINILWEAYKAKSFDLPEMSKLQFVSWAIKTKSRYQEFLLVEKDNSAIAFVAAYFDGWKYEPHVEFFSWASKKDILRSSVEFFTELGKLDTIGVIVVKSLSKTSNLFSHVVKFGCLEFIGKMPNGDYRGDEYIYSKSGNAKFPTATKTPTAGRL